MKGFWWKGPLAFLAGVIIVGLAITVLSGLWLP